MNNYINNEMITKMRYGLNFSYLLNDSSLFSATHFKMLQSQTNINFVRCVKVKYNGKLSFLYLVDELKSFEALVKTVSARLFLKLVASLFQEIIKVKNSEFFLFQNISISFDSIFVDVDNLTINLIYLPIQSDAKENYFSTEKNMRLGLHKLINASEFKDEETIMQLSADLIDDIYSLEALQGRLLDSIEKLKQNDTLFTSKFTKHQMRLISIDAPEQIEIVIDKDDFLIGKNILVVDGAITFSRAISRIHCKVVNNNGRYYLVDLGSSNGTFVNKMKLTANKLQPLIDGDIVHLASSSFKVKID